MGNNIAAEKGVKDVSPSLSPEHPAVSHAKGQETSHQTEQHLQPESRVAENERGSERGPGSFEDIHRKCKDIFPSPFDGAKIIINKGLSNHFNITHTVSMSNMQPAGYRFGCTYVGSPQYSPNEVNPILMGEIDPSGNLNANIIYAFSKRIRSKFVAQVQNNKWLANQVSTDYRGDDFTASLTAANIDITHGSGVLVGQYLQNITERLAVGSELMYQFGGPVPGKQAAIYTLAAKYAGSDWLVSAGVTPAALGVHVCYSQKVTDLLQLGVELEGSLSTQECTTTVGYQYDMPHAGVTVRGQVDSNWCVGAVFEKKLQPLPFTLALSSYLNHVKCAYRFGIGFILG